MRVILACLLLGLVAAAAVNASLCVSTEALLSSGGGYLSYPVDVFPYNASGVHITDKSLIKCESYGHLKRYSHSCVDYLPPKACPLTDSNVKAAASATTWPHASLCNLHSALTSEARTPIKVIVLGGSFTFGRSTMGCCCDPRLDDRCKANVCSVARDKYDSSSVCRWSNFLSVFLNTRFKADITVVNLASTGLSTDKVLLDHSASLRGLSSADLVILDHSVNDGFWFNRPGYDKTLLSSLEHLIRYIFEKSVSAPAIVLLEVWPYPYGGIKSDAEYKRLSGGSSDYGVVYRRIAEHYSVPLWSYRDMVWGSSGKTLDASILPLLRFAEGGQTLHPPWYFHLLFADMLAALLLNDLDKCNGPAPAPRNTSNLPPAMTSSEVNLCSSLPGSSLLSLSFLHEPSASEDLLRQHNITQIGGRWRHTADVPNRYGLISELNHKGDTKRLVVPIPNQLLQLDSAPHLIQIKYLRTYKDAGMFDLLLCGNVFAGFDTLWRDFRSFRVSTYETANIIHNPFGSRRHEKFCYNNRTPTFEIEHYQMRDNLKKQSARGAKQKIKIASMQVCLMDTKTTGRLY